MKEIFLICQKKRKNPDKHTNKILFEKREKRERERERERSNCCRNFMEGR
jgi:hypothetical protein